MLSILTIAALFSGLYLIVICGATIQWRRQSEMDHVKSETKKISIVVIARNEEQSIGACLRSIADNNYDKKAYEIILMDDHSDDQTVAIAQSLKIENLRVLRLQDYNLNAFKKSYKKAGQYYAIQESQYDTILQTDGDCICPFTWISDMSDALKDQEIITGPIFIKGDRSFLSRWQTFENIGTMVVTYAGIRSNYWQSANAANMVYTKKIYQKYSQVMDKDMASGDDIFLINWAHQQGHTIGYNKSVQSIVKTEAEVGIKNLFDQRLRWATKTKRYSFLGLKLLMGGFFIFHFLIVIFGIGSVAWSTLYLRPFLLMLSAKWMGDVVLLSLCSPFFKERYPLILSPIFSIVHMLYVVVIGFCGVFLNNYKWKGRTVK